MQLPPAFQSLFSFHLGCGYARNKILKNYSLSTVASYLIFCLTLALAVKGKFADKAYTGVMMDEGIELALAVHI